MTILKTALLGATIACAALANGALAADLPIPPGYEMAAAPLATFAWTGVYAGADVGYAIDENSMFSGHADDYPATGSVVTRVNYPGLSPKISDDGVAAGGHVGYNFNFGRVLVGVEADASYLDTGKSYDSGVATTRGGVDFLGTFRARAGYTFGNALFYGTGGLAYGSTFASLTPDSGQVIGLRRDDVRVGYAAGGGIEFALGQDSFPNLVNARGITARVEYVHYDLGTSNLGSMFLPQRDGSTVYLRDKAHFSGDLVRTGLSKEF